MKILAVFFFVVASFGLGQARADSIKLDNAPISNVVRLYFAEINQAAYSLPDDLIKDDRRVSLSITGTPDQLRSNLTFILRGYGYELVKESGLFTVRKLGGVEAKANQEVFIYRPKSRTSQYLVDEIRHLYPGVSQSAGGLPNTPPVSGEYSETSATAQLSNRSDRVIFKGTPSEIKDLRRLLVLLDEPTPSVELEVILIEYSKTKNNKTGFSALIDKLGPFSLAMGGAPAGDVLRFSSGAVSLAISALKSDNEFKIFTSPRLLLVDRKKSRLVVGQDVPILTSTTNTDNGVTQSIEYRSSGVIMEALANILDDSIEIDSSIEVSSFSETTTGVSSSPTLTKRSLQSSTILSDGSAVLFGGLRSAAQTEGSSGLFFLPKLMRQNNSSSDDSELFVLMSAKRI